MLFHTHVPRPPLYAFIDDFWLYEEYEGRHLYETILPSGTFEIVFNLREDELRIYGTSKEDECRRFAGAAISGPYAGSFVSDVTEEASIMGVHFKPGGAAAVLGLPAGDFANTHVDLQTIWGRAASALREELCELRRPAERFRLLERTLMERLAGLQRRHAAVRAGLDLLIGTRGQSRIRDVAGAVGLSPRRFVDVFTAEAGLTPKLFARVQRFQHAIARSRTAAEVDWAELAVECGYCDQSHLIREFIALAGVTPAEFRERQGRLDRAGVHIKRHHLPLA